MAKTKETGPMDQEIPEPKNVHEAINIVMGRVGYVQKKDAKGLPYKFAGEADFIKAVRPHLVDVGLVVFQSGVELLGRYEFTAKSGALGINILAKFTWTWVHAVSETSIKVTTIGEAADYGDKAANKAMTAAMKYNMRQTLIIETGDDPDTTPSTDYEQPAKKKTTTGSANRKENQWESDIIDTAMDLGLAQARPHAINRLNNSVFMDTPYGKLETVDAVAYLMAWEYSMEKYPGDDTPKRAGKVNSGWTKFKDKATEALGGQ